MDIYYNMGLWSRELKRRRLSRHVELRLIIDAIFPRRRFGEQTYFKSKFTGNCLRILVPRLFSMPNGANQPGCRIVGKLRPFWRRLFAGFRLSRRTLIIRRYYTLTDVRRTRLPRYNRL